MAQAGRRKGTQRTDEMSETLGGAEETTAETTEKVASAMARCGEVLVEGQAELLDEVDQAAQRWMENRRAAIDATRQAISEMQQMRDFSDILRVQQEWWALAWQRFNTDFQALASLATHYQRRAMMWGGEVAQATEEQMERGEAVMLRAAGDKPAESRRE